MGRVTTWRARATTDTTHVRRDNDFTQHLQIRRRRWRRAAATVACSSRSVSSSSSSLCARTRRLRIFYYIIRCRSRARRIICGKRFSYFLTSPRVTNVRPAAVSRTPCRPTVLDTTSFGRVSRARRRRCSGGVREHKRTTELRSRRRATLNNAPARACIHPLIYTPPPEMYFSCVCLCIILLCI